jgi:hypothetical protein
MADLMDSMQNSWVDSVINRYSTMNFIDRVAHPEKYPTLPMDDGSIATHLMMWDTMDDGTNIVFPSVIFDQDANALKALKPDEAYKYAIEKGEYIPFPTANAAETFSREYKRHWRDGKEPSHRGAPPQK